MNKTGKSWTEMEAGKLVHALQLLLAELKQWSGVVLSALGCEDYLRRVVEFMCGGAFTPGEEYRKAKRIMGFNFYGVEHAFRVGLILRHVDIAIAERIPFRESTLMQCADTHVLVLVPRSTHTLFSHSKNVIISRPDVNVKDYKRLGWHWVLINRDPVGECSIGCKPAHLFDVLYAHVVVELVRDQQMKVAEFGINDAQIVVRLEQDTREVTADTSKGYARMTCEMVTPDEE